MTQMSTTARELYASITSDPDAHMIQTARNLTARIQSGTYDASRAWFLVWNNVRDAVRRATRYGHRFNTADRRDVTRRLLQDIETGQIDV